MTRVAIVDDHPVVRDGTAALLAAQPDIDIAWTAGSLQEARQLIASGPVEVLLLDIRLEGESGLRLLAGRDDGRDAEASATEARRPAVVVLTAYDYPQYVEAAHRLGAGGGADLDTGSRHSDSRARWSSVRGHGRSQRPAVPTGARCRSAPGPGPQ
jgi:DNA-binding NarL/FixJ family response regulator